MKRKTTRTISSCTIPTPRVERELGADLGKLLVLVDRELFNWIHDNPPLSLPSRQHIWAGASGILLGHFLDPKKDRHMWKVLVTLNEGVQHGKCVEWVMDAKLFKRGWNEA